YLLTTVKLVTEELSVIHGINYAGKELKRYRPLYGRVLIKYHKDFQASVVNAESKLEKLVVSQVLPDVYK
ncbi:endonuclease, partial [Streptococcus sp. KR]